MRSSCLLIAVPLDEKAGDSPSPIDLAKTVDVQLRAIFSAVRKDNFFQMKTLLLHRKIGSEPWPVPNPTQLIPAVHKGSGVGVFLDFKLLTQLDKDMNRAVWSPEAWQLEAALEVIRWSQKATHDLLGRPFGGKMPYAELADFM
ncbi:MAG: hypothetical protein QXQ94_09525 [Candidatus Bathyarchaeia archaeon]